MPYLNSIGENTIARRLMEHLERQKKLLIKNLFVMSGNNCKTILVFILTLVNLSCKNNTSEEIRVYQKGDTLFYRDSLDIKNKPLVFYILGQDSAISLDNKNDSIISGNEDLNSDVSYRFIKEGNNFVKKEVFIVGTTTSELYFISFNQDSVKCGEDLIVIVNKRAADTLNIKVGTDLFSSKKLGNTFNLKVKTSCKNKGVHKFLAKVNSSTKQLSDTSEVEFNYFVW